MGIRQFTPDDGILHSDNTIGVGIVGVTHDDVNLFPLITFASTNYLSSFECLALDTTTATLTRQAPCTPQKAICKSKLAQTEAEEFVSEMTPKFYYPRLSRTPTPFSGANRHHLELNDFVYTAEKRLDVDFPRKVVISGLAIETMKSKYLKAFTLEHTKSDYVAPDVFEPLALKADSPIEFFVFNGDPNSADLSDVISRRILFPWPLLTRRIRLRVTQGASDVALKLDFIGKTAEKQNIAERRLEPNRFAYDVPAVNFAPDDESQFAIDGRICPNGEISIEGRFGGVDFNDPEPTGDGWERKYRNWKARESRNLGRDT